MTLIGSLLSQLTFLQETNILPKSQMCDKCNQELSSPKSRGNFVYYQCGKCKSKIWEDVDDVVLHQSARAQADVLARALLTRASSGRS